MSGRKRVAIPIRPAPGADLPTGERAAVLDAIERHRSREGALIPILHAVQDRLGWIPPKSIPLIAFELNISRAEVHGVVTFYHYFRQQPPGRHVIHLCRAEACQAVGAVALENHARRVLGTEMHGTSADGAHSLEPVYCLGNCAMGPSLLYDGELHACVTPERFDELLREAEGTGASSPTAGASGTLGGRA
jgi:formate dehydrogenase subunit gamma